MLRPRRVAACAAVAPSLGQNFRGVIERSKAVILVAQAMPELAALDFQECALRRVAIPAACRSNVAFMRVWCLVRRKRPQPVACQPLRRCLESPLRAAAT